MGPQLRSQQQDGRNQQTATHLDMTSASAYFGQPPNQSTLSSTPGQQHAANNYNTSQHYSSTGVNLSPIPLNMPQDKAIFAYLDKLNVSINNMNTSITALRSDLNASSKSHDDKLALLEKKMDTKYDELSVKLNLKHDTYEARLGTNSTLTDKNTNEIESLKQMLQAQQIQINELTQTVDADRFTAKAETLTVLKLANSIENHQRRWAVRIMGIPQPTTPVETTDTSKKVVLDFIANTLKIGNVKYSDVDCAHRVGPVTDKGTQTMLTRFFSRDLAQLLQKNRTTLKGSPLVLFEDCSVLSKNLLREVKNHDGIESGWYYSGQVWGKPKSGGKKVKFELQDNIAEKLHLQPAVPPPNPIFNPATPPTAMNNTGHAQNT
jgi:hypothetical protein